MNANELKSCAYFKMLEAMRLLREAYKLAAKEADEAKRESRHAGEVFSHLRQTYVESEEEEVAIGAALEILDSRYEEAWQRADSLQYEVECIENALMNAQDAIEAIEMAGFEIELDC